MSRQGSSTFVYILFIYNTRPRFRLACGLNTGAVTGISIFIPGVGNSDAFHCLLPQLPVYIHEQQTFIPRSLLHTKQCYQQHSTHTDMALPCSETGRLRTQRQSMCSSNAVIVVVIVIIPELADLVLPSIQWSTSLFSSVWMVSKPLMSNSVSSHP